MRVLAAATPKGETSSPKPKEVAPFLRSLRKMLEVESDEVLRWTADGRAFEIHDMKRMMEAVLPKYFKHRKYTSFQRQLNYFNFRKWTKSKAVVCTFSNDCFQRDRPDLAWTITRKKSVQLAGCKSAAGGGKGAKHGGASLRTAPTSSAGPSMDLLPKPEPLPMMTPLSHHAMKVSVPNKTPWKTEDMVIRVPRVPAPMLSNGMGDGFGGNGLRTFPSPTDMEMVLMENDLEPQRYYPSAPVVQPALSEQEVDSLEWIDNFLPSLESVPRQGEQIPYVVPVPSMTSNVFMRAGPSYMFPSPQPASDYMCLATM